MGLYDIIVLDSGVELPQFPEALDPAVLRWQTKALRRPRGDMFKISDEGRLLRRETAYREKTDAEKRQEAVDHGFDSWDEYVSAVDDQDPPDLDTELPTIIRSQVKADSWWVDHNYHGTFEFYAANPDDVNYDITWTYEARFSRGALDEIAFLGDRFGDGPDDVNM